MGFPSSSGRSCLIVLCVSFSINNLIIIGVKNIEHGKPHTRCSGCMSITSVVCPKISFAKHIDHTLIQSVAVSLRATARGAEEQVCGTAVWPAMKIQLDKTD